MVKPIDICHGNRFLVFGLARSGLAAITFLKQRNKSVIGTDDNLDILEKLSNTIEVLSVDEAVKSSFDFIVVSPIIRTIYKPNKLIIWAKDNNIPIITDFDILFSYYPKLVYIGITGTDGKSTTASLLHHLLLNCGENVLFGGNIGIPVLNLVCDKNIKSNTIIVLEISSFQLEQMQVMQFDYCIITNIGYDHIDYHGSIEVYESVKQKIISNRTKRVALNRNCHKTKSIIVNTDIILFSHLTILECGVSAVDKKLYLDNLYVGDIRLHNSMEFTHNYSNVASVFAILSSLNHNIKDALIHISDFHGLEHRCEFVRKIGNITFINDSKATNTQAASYDLSYYNDIFLIAGGLMKYDNIEDVKIDKIINVSNRIKKVFIIGKNTEILSKLLYGKIDYEICHVMENAVSRAYLEANIASTNDCHPIIMLCPFFVSWDQYRDFEERGRHFKSIVLAIEDSRIV